MKFQCRRCSEIYDDEFDLGMHLMWGHRLGKEIVEDDDDEQNRNV